MSKNDSTFMLWIVMSCLIAFNVSNARQILILLKVMVCKWRNPQRRFIIWEPWISATNVVPGYSLFMFLFSCVSENSDLQRRHQSVHHSGDHEYPKNTKISLMFVDPLHKTPKNCHGGTKGKLGGLQNSLGCIHWGIWLSWQSTKRQK